jgi:DNA-binding beta-propeller fold protein YncE
VIRGSFGFYEPDAISSDGTRVWVADGAFSAAASSATELTAATGPLVKMISGGNHGLNDPARIASDGTNVWVANAGSNSVSELPAWREGASQLVGLRNSVVS